MALIKCEDCGKEFSDKASACPNCGCPTMESKNNIVKKQLKSKVKSNNNEIIKDSIFFKGLTNAEKKKVKKYSRIGFFPITIISTIILLSYDLLGLGVCLFFGILFGICGSLFISAFISGYYISKKGEEEKRNMKIVFITTICIFVGAIFLGVLFSGGNGGSNSSPSDSEMDACRARSSTYYKCHWSGLENRCICKYR